MGDLSKKFNGKKYKYHQSFERKTEAIREATKLRQKGYLVRVYPQKAMFVFPAFHKGRKEHIEYEIYIRK